MGDWIGLLVSAGAGVILVATGIPLAQRRIRRNGLYGFRIHATLQSDTIWYPVNERGGRHLVMLGGALLFLALISLIFLGNEDTQTDFAILAAMIILAGVAWSAWSCIAYAKTLERQIASKTV